MYLIQNSRKSRFLNKNKLVYTYFWPKTSIFVYFYLLDKVWCKIRKLLVTQKSGNLTHIVGVCPNFGKKQYCKMHCLVAKKVHWFLQRKNCFVACLFLLLLCCFVYKYKAYQHIVEPALVKNSVNWNSSVTNFSDHRIL